MAFNTLALVNYCSWSFQKVFGTWKMNTVQKLPHIHITNGTQHFTEVFGTWGPWLILPKNFLDCGLEYSKFWTQSPKFWVPLENGKEMLSFIYLGCNIFKTTLLSRLIFTKQIKNILLYSYHQSAFKFILISSQMVYRNNADLNTVSLMYHRLIWPFYNYDQSINSGTSNDMT